MHGKARAQVTLRVQKFENGEPAGLPCTLAGRAAWALRHLIESPSGCTPLTHPAMRWAHYIYLLRKDHSINVETIHEKHGGPFPGTHARYFLRDDVRIIEDRTRSAA